MKSNEEQLRSRGYIEEKDLAPYKYFSKEELLELLKSKIATDRTIAVRLLVKYKDLDVIKSFISMLTVEKKLYTKIALSESIGEYGEEASKILINYLGKVGNNQHKSLPNKPFKKKNYPLPRDIVSRTLCKIGSPALNDLRSCFYTGEYIQILEAIDAIGFISYYEGDNTCLEDILKLANKYKEDELMTWKLLRALQAFEGEEVLDILGSYSESNVEQHRWEAMRSIEQIKRRKEQL